MGKEQMRMEEEKELGWKRARKTGQRRIKEENVKGYWRKFEFTFNEIQLKNEQKALEYFESPLHFANNCEHKVLNARQYTTSDRTMQPLEQKHQRNLTHLQILALPFPPHGQVLRKRVDEIAANNEKFGLGIHTVEMRNDEIESAKLFIPTCQRGGGRSRLTRAKGVK